MNTRRFVLKGLTAGAVAGALIGCRKRRSIGSLAEFRRRANDGEVTVGFIPYYEIVAERGQGPAPAGFMMDLFSMFAKAVGFSTERVKWRTSTWSSFGAMVQSGAVDLSIAGTFVTPARSQVVAFTRPLFSLGNGAVARRGDVRFKSVTGVMELDRPELRIAVVSGEQSSEFVGQHFKHAQILVLDGPDLAVAPLAVQQGKADVALSDQFILSRFVDDHRHHDLIDILRGRPFSVLPIAWALSKQSDNLLSEINPILEIIVNGAEFAALRRRYPVIPFADTRGG